MELDLIIWRYCGLTSAQWDDLTTAERGNLKSINGARRRSLKPLLQDDLSLTGAGAYLLHWGRTHIDGVNIDGVSYKGPFGDTSLKDHAAKIARLQDKHNFLQLLPKPNLYSVHFKIIFDLWNYPGLNYRYLFSLYGEMALKKLMEWEIIRELILPIRGTGFGAMRTESYIDARLDAAIKKGIIHLGKTYDLLPG